MGYAGRVKRPLSDIATIDAPAMEEIVGNVDISGKVDKVTGKGLSTNDYTTIEKNKLSGLPKITISDTEPSNPGINDLWIDTNI